MRVALDMEKLQMIIYYTNSIRMSAARREELHQVVLQGILVGEVDLDLLFSDAPQLTATNIRTFLRSYVEAGGNEGEVRAQELYDAYVEWCGDMAEPSETVSTFGRYLREIGIRKMRTTTVCLPAWRRMTDDLVSRAARGDPEADGYPPLGLRRSGESDRICRQHRAQIHVRHDQGRFGRI